LFFLYASMTLRHVSSAYFAEDVHASFCILCALAYLIGTTTFVRVRVLVVASMIFHSRVMYVSNGTGQWACVLQCFWYRDDPIVRYHVFVVKFDYTIVYWSYLHCVILHYMFICYLYNGFGLRGQLPRDICPVLYCLNFVVVLFTSRNVFHVYIVCFSCFR
jgi:hypothetical protein